MRRSVVAVALVIVLLALIVSVPSTRAQQPADVGILFDLGDGTYSWSNVRIPDRLAPNASWDATLTGAAMHGLRIKWAWSPSFGVGVLDIGDRNPPAGFAGLYLWNRSGGWELASVGISSLVLQNGDTIAWYNAAFNPYNWSLPARLPVATPGWPTPSVGFRGDAMNTGVSGSEAPNFANVLWNRDLGVREIVSTPAAAYGGLYVETFGGLYALDDYTGAVRWRNPSVKGFSSPAVVDGTVVVGSSNGSVYRVDRTTGQTLWSTRLLAQTNFSGITSSPKIVFDRVYVGTLNESGGPGEVVALWLSNGTVGWRHATGSIHYSSPAYSNRTVFVGVMGRYNTTTQITFDPPYGVLALDAASGTERWFFPTSGPVAASPVIAGSRVLVPCKDGSVYAIDRASGRQAWRARLDAGVSSPAFDGSTLYVGGGAFGSPGRITALDPATGAVRWNYTPNGPVQSSVVYADGKVFFSTNAASGRVYALNAATGELVWFYAPVPANFILASPVVSNGTVYAPSDNGHVYAFRESATPSEPPLTISAPSEIVRGGEAKLSIAIGPGLGLLRNVSLTVRVEALDFISASVPPEVIAGTMIVWRFPTVQFGQTVPVFLIVRAPATASGTARVVASFTFVDNDVVYHQTPTREASLSIVVPPAQNPAYLYLGLGIAAGVAIFIAAVVLVWRQRRAPP